MTVVTMTVVTMTISESLRRVRRKNTNHSLSLLKLDTV